MVSVAPVAGQSMQSPRQIDGVCHAMADTSRCGMACVRAAGKRAIGELPAAHRTVIAARSKPGVTRGRDDIRSANDGTMPIRVRVVWTRRTRGPKGVA